MSEIGYELGVFAKDVEPDGRGRGNEILVRELFFPAQRGVGGGVHQLVSQNFPGLGQGHTLKQPNGQSREITIPKVVLHLGFRFASNGVNVGSDLNRSRDSHSLPTIPPPTSFFGSIQQPEPKSR